MAENAPSIPPRELRHAASCVGCGYELFGLRSDGSCPECGTPVSESMSGDFLWAAPPRHVRALARGATAMLCGVMLTMAGVLLAAGIVVTYGYLAVTCPAVVWVVALSAIAGCLCDLYGAWLLASRDPRDLWRDGAVGLRRVVRGTALLAPAIEAMVVFSAMSYYGALRSGGAAGGHSLLPLAVLFDLVWLLGQFARLAFCRRLARRIPDEGLAQRTNRILWQLGLAYALIPLMAASRFLDPARPGGLLFPLTFGLVIVPVSTLIFGVAWLMLLFRCRRQFRRCALAAEARRAPAAVATDGPCAGDQRG